MKNTKDYRVPVNEKISLKEFSTNSKVGIEDKEAGLCVLEENRIKIAELQHTLFAEGKQSLLVVIQAMDTGGKDGTIRHVFKGVNPQGVKVTSFGKPSEAELSHDYLWRVHQTVPPKGCIGVFNRSHYEDVLVVRVHNYVPQKVWSKRYEQINAFEKTLSESGTRIVKLFLNISKEEQRERLQARIDTPHKRWKFNKADLGERKLWDDYQVAFEAVLSKCSKKAAPWYVIPADRKWARSALISQIIRETLEEMAPQFPEAQDDHANIIID